MDWLTWTYQADAPYLFVIYAREDADSVQQEMKWLHEQEFNVRCDIDMHADDVWSQGLSEAIEQAVLVLCFVSPRSTPSAEFRQMLEHAVKSNSSILDVHLQDVKSSSEPNSSYWEIVPILKYALSEDEYRKELTATLMIQAPDTRIQPITTPAMPVMDEKGAPNLVQHGLIALSILVLGILAYIALVP
jgi:hypothetical protein